MGINIQRPAGVNVTVFNPEDVLYVKGDADTDESWRMVIPGAPPARCDIQKRETLNESNFILDQAKVTEIEAGGFTAENPFFGSVLTDSRVDQTTPAGLNGDMTGRVIQFDGFLWRNYPDQWVTKGSFEESIFSDRGIFRRMNIIDTNPNDNTDSPPIPVEGTTIGARNTISDGSGIEMLSLTNKDGFFGMIPVLLHGGSIDAIDQLISILEDNTVVSGPYEQLYISGTVYSIGDVIIDKGVRFICNTDGSQIGDFIDNISFWDPDLALPNFDIILVDDNGDVISDENGNIVTQGC